MNEGRDGDALRGGLCRELARLETEQNRIQEEMNRILLESSNGLPFSEGQSRTMKAGVEARAAFEKYQRANDCFRAFVEEGIAGLQRVFGADKPVQTEKDDIPYGAKYVLFDAE